MKSKKDLVLTVVVIFLALAVTAASIVYLVTEKMVPGLIPLLSAVLMVPMILVTRKQPTGGKLTMILFIAAAILNLIAGIMQIVQAF